MVWAWPSIALRRNYTIPEIGVLHFPQEKKRSLLLNKKKRKMLISISLPSSPPTAANSASLDSFGCLEISRMGIYHPQNRAGLSITMKCFQLCLSSSPSMCFGDKREHTV